MSDVMSVRLHCRVFACWGCWSILLTAWRWRWNRAGSGRGALSVGSAVTRCGTEGRSGFVILEVSGRRTTLVWRRRRFWCGNCGERHLEDHAQFQGGLSRRFARRLVRDARVMSIRVVARHHGVGWHRNILGLVRAHSGRVAQRRRAGPTRVLLVDETSIRRRHRYVTVVASGDSGEVLAMIPGRTKGSLARFFREERTGAGGWR